MTTNQEREVKKFLQENDAKVTAVQELKNGRLIVAYELAQAPAQESLSSRYLPEWAEVLYGPLGTQLDFQSSWDERRSRRQVTQAAFTGSLAPT